MFVVRRKTVNIKQMFVNIDATSNKKQQWHHEDKNIWYLKQYNPKSNLLCIREKIEKFSKDKC